MESLNMNTLASSLPNSANAEKQLMDNFKGQSCRCHNPLCAHNLNNVIPFSEHAAAALSITTLYRSSLDTSKRAYSAGYATCLLDVLHFVEAGVSVSGNAGEEMTIGRVMDWIEARLEAIKSTEEEEEEERMKDGPPKAAQEDLPKEEREKRIRKISAGGSATASASKLHRRSKENLHEAPQTTNAVQPMPSPRAPSSSPPARSLNSTTPPPPPVSPQPPHRGR
jgi:hypothetical protein